MPLSAAVHRSPLPVPTTPNVTERCAVVAQINPVTYVMEELRSLIVQGFEWDTLAKGFAVLVSAAMLVGFLSVSSVNHYD